MLDAENIENSDQFDLLNNEDLRNLGDKLDQSNVSKSLVSDDSYVGYGNGSSSF